MKSRYRNSAFIGSIAVHVGMVFWISASSSTTSAAGSASQSKPAMSVYFVQNQEAVREKLSQVQLGQQHSAIADNALKNGNLAELGQDPQNSVLSVVKPPEPRYFRPSELTEFPVVIRDISSQLAISGVPSQTLILRLFINDDGSVIRVVVEDSYLQEKAEHQIVDAFKQAKFTPGKIGRIAVRSQIKIQVMLEDADRSPA
ncbi:energy transducer TonB [Herbaspirillum sp. GCM10030257]|uniref:energy transducer TonB n=1 Tax=Herbaspirillum sp. GCM10030257 TaxID=3273393 RepID=UPI0036239D27